jgi:dihydrolipoamide dehydrogenase
VPSPAADTLIRSLVTGTAAVSVLSGFLGLSSVDALQSAVQALRLCPQPNASDPLRQAIVFAELPRDATGDASGVAFLLVVAVGIVGNVENLGLEALGVKVEKTHVVVDGMGRTNVPGLYAIGDVCGPPWLAHKAMHEGVVCVEGMAGVKGVHAFDPWNVPGCTYSNPQVASVGMTEEKAKASGRKLKVGKFPAIGNGKAIALGEPEGLVKTIFDAETGELLGAHLVGAEVTELIQGFVIARQGELTEAELMETIFPHPTLSEMMHESVLSAYGRPLHI